MSKDKDQPTQRRHSRTIRITTKDGGELTIQQNADTINDNPDLEDFRDGDGRLHFGPTYD